MDHSGSSLPPYLRWLVWSWPVGRLFGVSVRVHFLTILVPLFYFVEAERLGYAGPPLVLALVATAALYLVILTHEFGHITAARRYAIPSDEITLSPLGGLAHLQEPAPTPPAEILISLAGPATHLLWVAVLFPVHRFVEIDSDLLAWTVAHLWFLNVSLLLFNLLPIYPLDGGRVLRGALSLRLHPNHASLRAAQVGFVGGLLLIIGGIWGIARPGQNLWGGLLIAIGLTVVLACRQEIMRARYGDSPYGRRREAWEMDADAWKQGGVAFAHDRERERRPGFVARKRRERAARAEQQRTEERDRLREELDQLLARVSEVGMAGLTEKERAALDRASKALRSSSERPDGVP